MGMIPQNQRGLIGQFQSQSSEKQAEQIAKKCNELGITKEQLAGIINAIKK